MSVKISNAYDSAWHRARMYLGQYIWAAIVA